MEEPKSVILIRDFPGLVLQVEGTELPPGAASEQVNASSARTGSLRVRTGYRVVQFET